MNVLMVNPNRFRRHIPPVGLEYVCNSLLREKIEFDVIDFNFEPENTLYRKLQENNVDLVGLTVRNIDSAFLASNEFFLPPVKRVVERIKNTKNECKVVLGGAGFSSLPKEILEYTGADFGVVGYGEEALPKLVRTLRGKGDLAQIENLIWRKDGNFQVNPRSTCNYENLPARRRNIIRNRSYYGVLGVGSIETKRGCYVDCGYCCEPNIVGRQVVTRKASNVIDELRELKSQNINHVYFCDSEFNVGRREELSDFCEQLKRGNVGITWTASMDPDVKTITPKLLNLMREAGCREIFLSTDSGSDEILSGMGKQHTADDSIICSEYIRKSNIRMAPSYLIGWPGESIKTLDETISHIKRCRYEGVSIWAGIRIYPNTKLASLAVDDGSISEDADYLFPIFYRPEQVLKEFLPYLKRHTKDIPNCMLPSKVIDFMYLYQRNLYLRGDFTGGFLDFLEYRNSLPRTEKIKNFGKTIVDSFIPSRHRFIPLADADT